MPSGGRATGGGQRAPPTKACQDCMRLAARWLTRPADMRWRPARASVVSPVVVSSTMRRLRSSASAATPGSRAGRRPAPGPGKSCCPGRPSRSCPSAPRSPGALGDEAVGRVGDGVEEHPLAAQLAADERAPAPDVPGGVAGGSGGELPRVPAAPRAGASTASTSRPSPAPVLEGVLALHPAEREAGTCRSTAGMMARNTLSPSVSLGMVSISLLSGGVKNRCESHAGSRCGEGPWGGGPGLNEEGPSGVFAGEYLLPGPKRRSYPGTFHPPHPVQLRVVQWPPQGRSPRPSPVRRRGGRRPACPGRPSAAGAPPRREARRLAIRSPGPAGQVEGLARRMRRRSARGSRCRRCARMGQARTDSTRSQRTRAVADEPLAER